MSPRFQAFLLVGCALVAALNAAPAAAVLAQGLRRHREPPPVVQRAPAQLRGPARHVELEEPLHLVAVETRRQTALRSAP